MGAGTSGVGHQLLPRPLRRSAVFLSAVCAVVLAALAARYHGGDRPGGFDEWVHGNLVRAPLPLGPLASVVDAVPPAFVGLVAVLTVVLAARRRWRAAALATLGPGLALLVTEVGKRLVGRSLNGMLALPSGHTTGVTSVVVMIAVLRISRARHVRRAAVLGLLAATLAAAAIGLLMVALDFHYATDVIAGYCVAIVVPVAVALAIDRVPHRRAGHSEGAARSLSSLFRYVRALVSRKHSHPAEDVLSDLVRSDDGRLSDDAAAMIGAVLLFAGHETTVARIDLGVLLLTTQYGLAALVRDPQLVPRAVEGILHRSPRPVPDPAPGVADPPAAGPRRPAHRWLTSLPVEW